MGNETELLWPGAALLLLLLGAVAGLCVRCSRPGAKRTEKIYEQRNLQENQQSFSVASRTYSLVRQAWPGPRMDMAPDAAPTGKDKLLRFSTLQDEPEFARYQNFSKETPLSWSITTGGAPGSPPKMRTTPTPMRTCSSVGHGAGTQSQVERTPRTIRTQYPSTNGTSPCRLRSKSPEQHICPQRGARMRTRESQTT
ncbi:linker for activation of T-cells family member 2 isoform X5 [Cavia porcellus]|uniref:linker for activation of T-cells family member 2 isoform X5 n=1 Tax=Cavia porcellus TaxID=10141 RepID=UPI000C87A471|nr:linker for activation of T-cells family member 2 isoform X6 [Cavia porcellus]